MEDSLTLVLKNIGLTDKEAKVYLACLKNGTSVVSTIASTAGINRVTTYDILEKLKARGLVSYFTKKKMSYFTGLNPEVVVEQFEKRTNDLRSALPQFKMLSGETSHPRIRYFEGIEGIKAIYTDTLSSKTEILNYSNSKEIRKNWPTYDKDYVDKRAKKKIFLRGICLKDAEGEIVKAEDAKYFREMCLVSPEKFDFTNEINIYDDKVAIISFKNELIGMIIESTEIANSQRAIFNMCWQFSKMLETKGKMFDPMSIHELARSTEELKKSSDKKTKAEPLKSNLSMF
jgi:sugar-specific transcriptional regulator TrmB